MFAAKRDLPATDSPPSAEDAPPLAWRIINQAHIQPMRPPPGRKPGTFQGGLVLGDSEEDRRLRYTRKRAPVDSFHPSAQIEVKLDGHYAYGGVLHGHFGHFMSESVHRVLPTLRYDPSLTFLFVLPVGARIRSFYDLPAYMQQVYSFLGLGPETVRFIRQDTEVESLFVCETGSELYGGPKEAYWQILETYTEQKLNELYGSAPSHKRLYVSRSKLATDGGVFGGLCGERYLENALEAEGFEIFHPQDHPVPVQMDQYRKADVVIFLEGSACHGTQLLGRKAIANCIQLARRGRYRIMDQVLVPRAQHYSKCMASTLLGSIFERDGAPALDKGVALLDWEGVAEFLRTAGIARLSSDSRDAYMAAAAEDLSSYLSSSAPPQLLSKSPELVSRILASFEAAKQTA